MIKIQPNNIIQKSAILKTIRKAIADANNIPYEITECTSKGHCNGACPACDQEAQELSQLINSYVSAGKPVIIPSSETTLLDAYLPPKPIEEAWLEW